MNSIKSASAVARIWLTTDRLSMKQTGGPSAPSWLRPEPCALVEGTDSLLGSRRASAERKKSARLKHAKVAHNTFRGAANEPAVSPSTHVKRDMIVAALR